MEQRNILLNESIQRTYVVNVVMLCIAMYCMSSYTKQHAGLITACQNGLHVQTTARVFEVRTR
jgi:hypothetical protein